MSVHVSPEDDADKMEIFIKRISCCSWWGFTKCCVIWCKLTPFVTFSRLEMVFLVPIQLFLAVLAFVRYIRRNHLSCSKPKLIWKAQWFVLICGKHIANGIISCSSFVRRINWCNDWNLKIESFDFCPFSAVAPVPMSKRTNRKKLLSYLK